MLINQIQQISATDTQSKIALFIRHAEREEGKGKYLSTKGLSSSESFGERLKSLDIPIVKIYSSPELRCVQTSLKINQQISNMENEVIISKKLSNLQINDEIIYQKLYEKHNFNYRLLFDNWKKQKYYEALFSPHELQQRATDYISSTCTEPGLTIYISQSGTVAGLGYVFDKLDYNVNNGEWIDYLEGFYLKVDF